MNGETKWQQCPATAECGDIAFHCTLTRGHEGGHCVGMDRLRSAFDEGARHALRQVMSDVAAYARTWRE